MVNAITHIHIETTRLTKERFVAGGAAAVAVTGGVVLRIRLGFHNHAPEQLATLLAFHQQATDEVGGNDRRWAAAKALGLEALICEDYLEVEAAMAETAPELVLGTQMERHSAKRLGIPCAVISTPMHVQDVPARISPTLL